MIIVLVFHEVHKVSQIPSIQCLRIATTAAVNEKFMKYAMVIIFSNFPCKVKY